MGMNYWVTYSPVVNMITVRLILSIAQINNLNSKAINFILAFPQDDLDVDIWKSSIKITQKNIAQLMTNLLKNIS